MNQFLNHLNLRPQEKRLVVFVLVVVFILLNFWFVWPHFNDWSSTKIELQKAREKLSHYQKETDSKRIEDLNKRLRELEGEGSSVVPAEMSLDLARAIRLQAGQSGIFIQNENDVAVGGGSTNEYFVERARNISVLCGENELINFLIALGSSNSMIRARSMNLQPGIQQTNLQGTITLVASYQTNRLSKPAVPVKTEKTGPTRAKTENTGSAKAKTPASATSTSTNTRVTPKKP